MIASAYHDTSQDSNVDEKNSIKHASLKFNAEDIHTLGVEGILTIKKMLQHGESLSIWETPFDWLPLGYSAPQRFDIKNRIVSYLPTQIRFLFQSNPTQDEAAKLFNDKGIPFSLMSRLLDQAVVTAMRYLILLRMGPSGSGRKKSGRSLAVTTINLVGYQTLPFMLAMSISKMVETISIDKFCREPQTEEIEFFSLIESNDMARLTRQRKINVNAEIERMQMLAEREFWSDVPLVQPALHQKVKVKGPAAEHSKEHAKKTHLPLPDDYVSAMGQRCIWLLESLGPSLLHLVEKFPEIWQISEAHGWSPGNIEIRRREFVERTIADHTWIDAKNLEVLTTPFQLELSKQGRKTGQKTPPAWPPRRFSEVMHLLLTVQMAHLFIVSMSMAGRTSEVLSLGRSCLQRSVDGDATAIGKTYKLIQRHGGEYRDWALPDIAGRAIEQQLRLISISEKIERLRPSEIRSTGNMASKRQSTDHLWGQVLTRGQSDPKSPLEALAAAYQKFAYTIGLPADPGGQNFRPHRIRKTVARLVALAITQAPKLLMEVLGHKSIEMTLSYILSDKDLRAEIEVVSRELRIIRAKDVIENLVKSEDRGLDGPDLEGYGGLAALTISRAINIDKDKHHRRGAEWGAESIESLAETLTLQGKAWQIVRPGVVCTKLPGTEFGPCNLKRGAPEPSRCHTSCSHRLEEGFLRHDTDSSIEIAIRAFEVADLDGDELLKFHWAEQVRSQIDRFSDLRQKWMNVEKVRSIVAHS